MAKKEPKQLEDVFEDALKGRRGAQRRQGVFRRGIRTPFSG